MPTVARLDDIATFGPERPFNSQRVDDAIRPEHGNESQTGLSLEPTWCEIRGILADWPASLTTPNQVN